MAPSNTVLRVLQGEDRGKGWNLDPRQVFALGRSRRCNLRLSDSSVSAIHARIECVDSVWRIIDQESSHGTNVNNQRILAGKALFDRDLIRIGKTQLEFREYEQLNAEDLAAINGGVHLPE